MDTSLQATLKQQQSQRSCARCRDKKVKCDKGEPCQRCRHVGVHCIYPTPVIQDPINPNPTLPPYAIAQANAQATYSQMGMGNNPAKRTKIKEPACIRCKEKRVKCDRTKPECRRCSTHRVQCEYPVRSIWVYDTTPRNFQQQMFDSDTEYDSDSAEVAPPSTTRMTVPDHRANAQRSITPPSDSLDPADAFSHAQQDPRYARGRPAPRKQQQQQHQQQQQQQQQHQQYQQQQQQQQQQLGPNKDGQEYNWEMVFSPGKLDVSSNLYDVNDLFRYVVDGMNQVSLSDPVDKLHKDADKGTIDASMKKIRNNPQEKIAKFDDKLLSKLAPDQIVHWHQMLTNAERTLAFPDSNTRALFRNIALQGLISHCVYYYFHCFSQKIPLVDKARFIERFHRRYGNTGEGTGLGAYQTPLTDEDIPPLTLYALCAFSARHACHFHTYKPLAELDRANDAANYFYDRARLELEEATLERGESSPEQIHALIHLAEYNEARGKDTVARSYQAMAVRMGIELGIHERIPAEDDDLWTPAEAEINRRLWWYLWLRDRTYVSRGREPVIPGDYEMRLQLPTPMTGEDEEVRHTVGCWVVEIGLMKVQREVVEKVLKAWKTKSPREVVEKVREIEGKLREVYDGLPVYLRLDGGYKYKVENRRAFLACIIVNLEYQAIWLQLHKPFLPAPDSPEAATNPFVKRSHSICSKAATLITILIDNCWKTGFCYTDMVELSRACDIHLREIQASRESAEAAHARAEIARTLSYLPMHPYYKNETPAAVQFADEIRHRLEAAWDQDKQPVDLARTVFVPAIVADDADPWLVQYEVDQVSSLPNPSPPPPLLFAPLTPEPSVSPAERTDRSPSYYTTDTDQDNIETEFDWDTTPSPGYSREEMEATPPISDEELMQLYAQTFGQDSYAPETDTGGMSEAALFATDFQSERGLKANMIRDSMMGWYHQNYDYNIDLVKAEP